jgi:hypothetical protein
MIDYLFRWNTETAAVTEVQQWPRQPGQMVDGKWVWDPSICYPVKVERKTGVDAEGNETRTPLTGFFLWLSYPRLIKFLIQRPALRIVRDRESGKVRGRQGVLTIEQIREFRLSPVMAGSQYDEANAELDEVDPETLED